MQAHNIHGTVFQNGTAALLARVLGNNGAPIVQADAATIDYSIYLLDDDDPDRRQPVEGHEDVALEPTTVILNELATDVLWTVDAVGYNFLHQPDASANPAFPWAGKKYLVEHRLHPPAGQIVLVRFRLYAI